MSTTNIERIIAKIDNDFNPDNSDWIPRVGAWCIDAMGQIDVLRTKRTKKKLTVKDRIAYSSCPIESDGLKVYDSNGCEIKKSGETSSCCGDASSTGDEERSTSVISEVTPNTISSVNTGKKNAGNTYVQTVNDKYPYRYNVYNEYLVGNVCPKTYVLIDCNKIELSENANDEYIYVETESVETNCDNTYGCELPVIPNNAVLIEAIVYYCIYKMLCRGYKHPVMNLAASQYGTNPYYMWMQLKEEARRSVLNDGIDEDCTSLFRSNFFINTFDPRN